MTAPASPVGARPRGGPQGGRRGPAPRPRAGPPPVPPGPARPRRGRGSSRRRGRGSSRRHHRRPPHPPAGIPAPPPPGNSPVSVLGPPAGRAPRHGRSPGPIIPPRLPSAAPPALQRHPRPSARSGRAGAEGFPAPGEGGRGGRGEEVPGGGGEGATWRLRINFPPLGSQRCHRSPPLPALACRA